MRHAFRTTALVAAMACTGFAVQSVAAENEPTGNPPLTSTPTHTYPATPKNMTVKTKSSNAVAEQPTQIEDRLSPSSAAPQPIKNPPMSTCRKTVPVPPGQPDPCAPNAGDPGGNPHPIDPVPPTPRPLPKPQIDLPKPGPQGTLDLPGPHPCGPTKPGDQSTSTC